MTQCCECGALIGPTDHYTHDRCEKCAAYYRGRMKAQRHKLAKLKRRRRRMVLADETNGLEEKMTQRGRMISEFLRTGN